MKIICPDSLMLDVTTSVRVCSPLLQALLQDNATYILSFCLPNVFYLLITLALLIIL